MNKNLMWLYDINIAHRGLHDISKGIPENSIIAFDLAIKENIAIELDVHIIKDGTLVIFHDDNLKRCCNVDKKIKDCTLKELSTMRLFDTEYKIPTLEDALSYIDSSVPIIIEIKSDVPFHVVCPKLYNILKDYNGKFAIKSFNPLNILWFKIKHDEIIRGLLASNFNKETKFKHIKKLLLSSLIFLPICKPDFLSIQLEMLKSKKIKKLKKETDIPILGWTFRKKIDRINYERHCDSYIFENMKKV